MFQRILVPVDLSEKNEAAVRIAEEYRAQHHAEVTLLHVIEPIEHIPFEEMKDFYTGLEDRIRESMRDLAAAFGPEAAGVSQEVVYGHRVEGIVDYAQQHEIGLIVMGSHRIDTSRPAHGWATISYRVAVLSPVPVLLVK